MQASDFLEAMSSGTQKPQLESPEQQDNSCICHAPLPETVSEEQEIDRDYNGCHQHADREFAKPRCEEVRKLRNVAHGKVLPHQQRSCPSEFPLKKSDDCTSAPLALVV